MTTTTAELTRPVALPGRRRLLAPFAGLALVAGLLAAFVTPVGGDTGDTAAEVVAYATKNETWTFVAMCFAFASIVLGAIFVAGLHARLRGVATEVESVLVLVGGTVFTLCFALSWAIWTGPLVDMPAERALALEQGAAYLAVDDIGWFVLAIAGVGAAVMAVTASLAALRGGVPAWLGWLGVLAGVASVLTVMFFGIFAWLAWIAVASIVLLVAPAREG
jgi:hypothetical protein